MIEGLRQYELRLRESITAVFRKEFSESWLEQAVPQEMSRHWRTWAARELGADAAGRYRGEDLIAYASLGDLFSLVERHWRITGHLVGANRREYDVFTRRLKPVRDADAHQRDIADSDQKLATGIIAILSEALRAAGTTPTRNVLSRAVDQFTEPAFGYGLSVDLLDQVWQERDALNLTDADIAVLVQSEALNHTRNGRRWFPGSGVSLSTTVFVLAHQVIRLQWVAIQERREWNPAGMATVIASIFSTRDPSAAARFLEAARGLFLHALLPAPETKNEQRFFGRLGDFVLVNSLRLRLDEMFVECNTGDRACRKVHGYEDPPDEEGRRLILEELKRPCHVALATGARRVSRKCRLNSPTSHLRGDQTPALTGLRIEQITREMVRTQHALDHRRDQTLVGVATWDDGSPAFD